MLAHGARTLGAWLDATQPLFPNRLQQLSTALGEVQFFATNRIVDYHAWACAIEGRLVRGYCYVGERGQVLLDTGEPTPVETALGLGSPDSSWIPDEDDVVQIAGAWSLNPTNLSRPPVGGVFADAMRLPGQIDAQADLRERAWAAIDMLRSRRG